MDFQFNDGGRASAGFKGTTGDCVTRAIAIATEQPYIDVYNKLHELNKEYSENHRGRRANKIISGGGLKGTTPRNGVFKEVYHPYLLSLGWGWTPCMLVGQGCKVHLKSEELPAGRLIVSVSKHMLSVIDGVANDIYEDFRGGTRCVYGYYSK